MLPHGSRIFVSFVSSLGRAWIAQLDSQSRMQLLIELKKQKINNWPQIEKEIHEAIESMSEKGYCVAKWLPEISAISTSVQLLNGNYASLNFSTPAESNLNELIENYTPALFELKNKIEVELNKIKLT